MASRMGPSKASTINKLIVTAMDGEQEKISGNCKRWLPVNTIDDEHEMTVAIDNSDCGVSKGVRIRRTTSKTPRKT